MGRIQNSMGIVIALTHLVLVTLGASRVSFEEWGISGKILDFYGALSGAGDSYGFFAPGIDGQLIAEFKWTTRDGKVQTAHLESGENHETDLRVGNIIDQFQNDLGEESSQFQRSMAASLAGTVFGRHPEAKEVIVRLDDFSPVSMEDFRNGKVPSRTTLYEAKFAHLSAASTIQ